MGFLYYPAQTFTKWAAMTRQEQIVAYARETLGTPTGHQGRAPGQALDCVGVVVHVAQRLGMLVDDVINYGRIPNPTAMRKTIDTHLQRVSIHDIQIGDVVWLSVERDPQHLGIICDYPGGGFSLLHAHNASGINHVVEHRLDDAWRMRIKAAWRYPESLP